MDRMHYGKIRQARAGIVMLWVIVCWEALGPDIHVDVTFTRTTFLNVVAASW